MLYVFLPGLIIGDGHLHGKKKRISIELRDKELIFRIKNLFYATFKINPSIYLRKVRTKNKKKSHILQIDNSPIYNYFNNILEIPSGKKSNIVKVPKLIKKSITSHKKSFLIGLFLADAGKRNYQVRYTSASKHLRDEVSELLTGLNIQNFKDQWKHKTYKKEYYGLYFRRKLINLLLRGCRSGQTGQIQNSFIMKFGGQA